MHLGVCLPRYMERPDFLAGKADALLKTPEEELGAGEAVGVIQFLPVPGHA